MFRTQCIKCKGGFHSLINKLTMVTSFHHSSLVLVLISLRCLEPVEFTKNLAQNRNLSIPSSVEHRIFNFYFEYWNLNWYFSIRVNFQSCKFITDWMNASFTHVWTTIFKGKVYKCFCSTNTLCNKLYKARYPRYKTILFT